MKTENKNAYHHGSLQEALVEFTHNYVRDFGWENFSLREAARKIGVSPGAAYRHFKTLDDLLLAVANKGFATLDANMQKKRHDASDAREELIGVGLAYIEFSKDEPHLFNLMFSDKISKLFAAARQEDCNASDCSQLEEAIHNYFTPEPVENMRGHCDFFWVLAHGIAALEATNSWQRSDQEKRAILERGIATLEASRKKTEGAPPC